MENKQELDKKRHSLAHLLAAAITKRYPGTKLGIGPTIENGFYYDFLLPASITPQDLPVLENKIKALIKQNIKFEREEVTAIHAKELFQDQPFKVELVSDLMSESASQPITTYKSGRFTDLCAGPHVESTKEISADAFKLTKIAGAYWKGNEKNQMLTRIYGVAFASKKELDEYLVLQEEAEKRDHRKLGKELDLFHIDEVVGLGLPLWHPKGAILWRIIEDFWYKEHLKNGYNLVRTPHIGNRALWETSGHWGFYNESMYPPMEVGQTLKESQNKETIKESEQFLLKPMNCPFHVRIYKSKPHSYKELPLRWAECGTVYRFEKKGELSGLTRVRGFTQDDAHIICRADQVEKELKAVVDFILFIYRSFGFNIKDVNVYLSVRDPQSTKYAGSNENWNFTEKVLEKVAKDKKLNIKKDIGGAVFYGPKLDFKIKDSLGREWQCSTLQFDFNLPERFDMSFVNEKGQQEKPYMLHRALFGSYERFIGILIEHFAGLFPLWIAPIQMRVLPISKTHKKYAKEVYKELLREGFRVELKDENETVGKKIREGEMNKIPYLLIVGDKEVKSKSVAVRKVGKGDLGAVKVKKFIEDAKVQVEKKK